VEENALVQRVSKILGRNVQHELIVNTVDALADKVDELNQQLQDRSDVIRYVEEAYETAKSKGWYSGTTEIGTKLALIHAEVTEALEADRRGEGKERIAEEFADICIRVFSLSGHLNVDLHKAIRKKMDYNKTRPYKHGGKKY
jgi:NTP pyrophosphatase (non-canonical NTP hydrolase)